MINILADKHLYKIADFLPDDVDLTLFDPQIPLREIPDGTHALLIRTDTKINDDTLPNLPPSLEFVATASAGTDHVDIPCLKSYGIMFADAAGCNAQAVAEYVATALLIWADTNSTDFTNLTTGIIGAGNTGGATQRLLESLGIATVGYDPPRAETEPDFLSATLDDVLACDVLTFHTPLNGDSAWPTYHWLDDQKLANHHYKLIINAARGGVVDEKALLRAYKNNQVEDYILDVWENEPLFNDKIAKNAFIKTPHIAGYSLQGKYKASAAVAAAFGRHFLLKIPLVPPPELNDAVEIPPSVTSLAELLNYLHPVKEYDQKFSSLIETSAKEKKAGFSKIRTTHPLRNEYHSLWLPSDIKETFPALKIWNQDLQD